MPYKEKEDKKEWQRQYMRGYMRDLRLKVRLLRPEVKTQIPLIDADGNEIPNY